MVYTCRAKVSTGAYRVVVVGMEEEESIGGRRDVIVTSVRVITPTTRSADLGVRVGGWGARYFICMEVV